MTKAIIPLVALVVALSSCGASAQLLNPLTPAQADDSLSWNPQAPEINVRPLDEALQATPAIELGSRRVTALTAGNLLDTSAMSALELAAGDDDVLTISARQPLGSVALYIRFSADDEHAVSVEAERPDGISIAILRPGLAAVGVAATTEGGLDPGLPLAVVHFASGPEAAPHLPAAISQVPRSAVNDLEAIWDGEGSGTLGWHERHNGDYNLDGEVNVSDITPVGVYFNDSVVEGTDEWAVREVVDGNENGLIEVADLTPIGQSFKSFITGYNIYRTPLDTPDEMPDPAADPGRWEKVLNDTAPDGPSAPRDYNGQKTRLQYTFLDTPENSGDYGWYVVPVGKPGETPLEGPYSNVATAEIGPPPVGLSFEIQPPQSELLNVGTEFYVGVKVANVTGLFSANIRFEYDSTLVSFVEAVPFYTDGGSNEHPNLLTPPLFVGVDVGDVGDGYREVGFNATERKDLDDPQDGEGFLGYVKFECIAPGINDQCFRFPQTSNYLYLWGETYGVPVGLPELGEPQIVNIAE